MTTEVRYELHFTLCQNKVRFLDWIFAQDSIIRTPLIESEEDYCTVSAVIVADLQRHLFRGDRIKCVLFDHQGRFLHVDEHITD